MRSTLRMTCRVALGGCVAFMGYAALATAPGTRAAASSTWYWQNPLPRAYFVTGIACRSLTACVAVGADGTIVTTNDGGQHWTERASGGKISLQGVTCPGRATCYALGSEVTGSPPAGQPPNLKWMVLKSGDGGRTWQQPSLPLPTSTAQDLHDLVCPTVTICLVGGENYSAQGQNPLLRTTDSGRTWRAVSIPGQNASVALTCATMTVCYAEFNSNSKSGLARSDDAGKTWMRHGLHSPKNLTAMACPEATTCFATALDCGFECTWGHIYVTRDGARTWKQMSYGTTRGIVCPSAATCYASGDHSVVRTTNSGKTWSVRRLPSLGGRMACPSTTTCYLTTLFGILQTRDGFDHTGKTLAHSAIHGQSLTEISCSNTVSCYAAGSRSIKDICDAEPCLGPASFVATTDGGRTWRATPRTPDLLERLSCPSQNICLAIGVSDPGPIAVDRSDDGTKTWHQIQWQKISTRIAGNNQASDITCVARTTCYLLATVSESVPGTNDFHPRVAVLVTHDAGQTWSLQTGIDTAAQAGETNSAIVPGRISCPSITTCFVLATVVRSLPGRLDQQVVLLSTTDGGETWTRHPTVPGTVPSGFGPQGLSCPSTTTCYLLSYTQNPEVGNPNGLPGPVLVTHDAGVTWQRSVVSDGEYLYAISCATTQSCRVVGVQAGPNSSAGIFATNDGGATWQRERMADGSAFPPMVSITCPAADTCYSVGGVTILATHPRGATPSVAHRVIRRTQHR